MIIILAKKKGAKMNKTCQYQSPACQKKATHQHIVKLGMLKLDKGYICQNCKEYLEKIRKENN